MILTEDQLRELTQRQKASAQCKVLDALGIRWKRRPDGSVVVFERDIYHEAKEKRPAPPSLRLSPSRGILAGQAR